MVYTPEKRGDTLIAVVEMDPFRNREAGVVSVRDTERGEEAYAITTSYVGVSPAVSSVIQSVVRKAILWGKTSVVVLGMGSGPWLCSQDAGK